MFFVEESKYHLIRKLEKRSRTCEYHQVIFLLPFLQLVVDFFLSFSGIKLYDYYKIVQLLLIFIFVFINYEVEDVFIMVLKSTIIYNIMSFLVRSNFFQNIDTLILKDFIVYFTYPLYFYYFYILKNLENSERVIEKLATLLFSITFILCLVNILLNYRDFKFIWMPVDSYSLNFKSIFPNRNQFAQLLLVTIIMADNLGDSFFKKKNIYMMLLMFNLLLTLSRTAISLSLLYFILKYIFVYKTRAKQSKHLFLFILIPLALGITTLILLSRNFIVLNKLIRLNSGLSGREDLWIIAVKIFRRNWMFGMGLSQSRSLISSLGLNNNQFHNMYLENLASYGIIGSMISVLLVIKMLDFKRDYSGDVATIKFIPFIIIAIYSFFESSSFFKIGLTSMILSYFVFLFPLII